MINYSKFIPQLEKMTNVIKTHLGKICAYNYKQYFI